MTAMGPGKPRQRARLLPGLLVCGHEIPLPAGETIVGRGTAARISIASGLVSRRHARLVNQDGHVTVEDLGSRNGIFVNGEPLKSSALLEDGDTLLVGTTELSFFLGATEDGQPTRMSFDEQGNLIPAGDEKEERESTTLVRFEAPNAASVLNLDREDITIQGSAPPPTRRTQAPEPLRVPTMPSVGSASGLKVREQDPHPKSGALPKLAPVARIARPGSGPVSSPNASAPISTHPPAGATPEAASSPVASSSPVAAGSDPLASVLPVVDRMLARGDVDAACRAFGAQISRRIDAIRAGHAVDPQTLEEAAQRCLLLLSKSGDATWFDRVIDLHSVARLLMRASVLNQVALLLPMMPAPSRERFAGYQAFVREILADVDVEDLLLCDRVLALAP